MAEKNRYPQIPSTVWWGLRSILQRTPTATIDERLLGVQLDVQEAGARAYLAELKAVALITEEGKVTPLGQKWRLDESYSDAVRELIENNYPEGLINVAPAGEGDRQKVVSWFMREGLGQGAAGNKAATYLLLGTLNPNEPPTRGAGRSNEDGSRVSPVRRPPNSPDKKSVSPETRRSRASVPDQLPLNINVQIHISADAGVEQIEAIFLAMRRYLHDNADT